MSSIADPLAGLEPDPQPDAMAPIGLTIGPDGKVTPKYWTELGRARGLVNSGTINATTEATSQTVLGGLTWTDPGIASSGYHVEFFCPSWEASANGVRPVLVLWDDDNGAAITELGACYAFASGAGVRLLPLYLSQRDPFRTGIPPSPGAGTHNYSVRAYISAGVGSAIFHGDISASGHKGNMWARMLGLA